MISEKYLAGFADADGHFAVRTRIGAKPDLMFSICQEVCFLEPLLAMQEMFGGIMRDKLGGKYKELCLRGGPARKVFERLKKYLVLKQDQAERFIDFVDSSYVINTKEQLYVARARLKELRGYGAKIEPNYPSRKWMAGYIDGDGSFATKVCKKTGYAYPTLTILAAPNYIVGVTLLQKVFGGRLQAIGQNVVWSISLTDPSKIQQVLGHCAQHLIKKQAQAYFLLGCAKHGNLRDGETIARHIRTLNAQQHRLSDSAALADRLLQTVDFSISKRPLGRPVGRIETKPRQKRQSDML